MDAEGRHEGVPCPRCASLHTITFRYVEGFEELECPHCGFTSDAEELDALTRYASDLVEGHASADAGWSASRGADEAGPVPDSPPIPRRSLKA